MLSRGSGTLLESRNTVRHDCKTNQEEVNELEGASEGGNVNRAALLSEAHLCVEVQLSGFDGGVAVEESGDQVVVPGAKQLLEFQQDVLVSGKNLKDRF